MKTYLKIIQVLQKLFLGISITTMLILPLVIVFNPQKLSDQTVLNLYALSHITVFLVMIVRPLADIFTGTTLIRPLVILRKGVGVFSASIIISFIFSKIIINPAGYFKSFATTGYWSLKNFALLAHLSDISAILLIVTSNNFSKRILGAWWKRVQRLSYIYFYASSLYVFLTYNDYMPLVTMSIVTFVTIFAYIKSKKRASILQAKVKTI